jgi:hypothetical protein
MIQYDKLVKFKATYGHCLVPKGYGKDKSLGAWIVRQRDTTRQDRKDLLDKLGFFWKAPLGVRLAALSIPPSQCESIPAKWMNQYDKLVQFKHTYGHCLVPSLYDKDKSLGIWVVTQQGRLANDTIRQDRKDLLDKLGFVWKAPLAVREFIPAKWMIQYDKLLQFKRTYGHCLVPSLYDKDKSLGIWVATQRGLLANNTIRQDRKDLLDKLGFVWKAPLGVRLAALVATYPSILSPSTQIPSLWNEPLQILPL